MEEYTDKGDSSSSCIGRREVYIPGNMEKKNRIGKYPIMSFGVEHYMTVNKQKVIVTPANEKNMQGAFVLVKAEDINKFSLKL